MCCPYCRTRIPNSEDHIFPQFLGGQATVKACDKCNNRFGHEFEGRISNDFAPFFVTLRRCGVKSKRPFVFKKAFRVDDVDYDINQDLVATPSKPVIQRDESGRIKRALCGNEVVAEQIARSMKAQPAAKELRLTRHSETLSNLSCTWKWNIGPELRRLVMKMCAALLAQHRPKAFLLNEAARTFLLTGNVADVPVRTAYLKYPALDAIRHGLAHSIFVEANANAGRCYGIVQFFGVMQFYAVLNGSYLGDSFAAFGLLDAASRNEEFRDVAPLGLAEAPLHISPQERDAGIRGWQHALTSLLDGRDGSEIKFTIEAPPLPKTFNNLVVADGTTATCCEVWWSSGTLDCNRTD